MKVINLAEQNTLLNQYLKEIRSCEIQKDSMRFRRNIERIGELMAYEISRCLSYAPETVRTPLADATVNTIQDSIVLGTIFRAGLPLYQGFLNMFDHAENAFLSAYRRVNEQGELEIVREYMAAPRLDGKTLILVDPMLASGMSMEIGYKALLNHGTPAKVIMACTIGSQQAIDYLEANMPEDAILYCAAVDPILNEHKYIVPGLGDAGDLCFGEKL